MPVKQFLSNQFFQVILFLLLLLFLWKIRTVLIILFIAVIIASAIYPISIRLQQKIPKPLALGLPYFLIVCIILFLIFSFIPILTTQSRQLVTLFPNYLQSITHVLHIQVNTADLRSFLLGSLSALSNNAYSITTTVFGELLTFFFTIFISIYLLVDRNIIHQTLSHLIPGEMTKNSLFLEEIEENLGAWARGQLLLSAVIFTANFIAYLLLGIPFALPLALLAGMLEVIPTVGPIIAAIPATIVALTISPAKALFVIGVYILIQVLEGNFLVPTIMQRVVGLHPIIVMLAILIGGELMGFVGALIAIPFVSLLTVILQKLQKNIPY